MAKFKLYETKRKQQTKTATKKIKKRLKSQKKRKKISAIISKKKNYFWASKILSLLNFEYDKQKFLTIDNKMKKIRKKIKEHFKTKWKNSWILYCAQSHRNKLTIKITDEKHIEPKLHFELNKTKNVLTIQIKIEIINLTNYLYKARISKITISICKCEYHRQTIKHIIIICSKHVDNRDTLMFKTEIINYRKLTETSANLKKVTR